MMTKEEKRIELQSQAECVMEAIEQGLNPKMIKGRFINFINMVNDYTAIIDTPNIDVEK